MHSGGEREFLYYFSWSDYSLGYIRFFFSFFIDISEHFFFYLAFIGPLFSPV